MNYQSYLLVLTQLLHHNKAKLIYEGKEILIDASLNNFWKLSTIISNEPSGIINKILHFNSYGGYLQADEEALYFIQEVKPLSKYSQFRRIMQAYTELYEEWSTLVSTR